MPERPENKPRLIELKLTNQDRESRRLKGDPYGFIGRTLAGRYQIEELVGMGGMAAVYRAKHSATTRTVAIKILKPDLAYTTPEMVGEFLNEAKATANLNHRNIIEVSDADQDEDGTTFLVMQYLNGVPLDKLITDEQPLAFERVAAIFEQICDGVQNAHANDIIHRDLKPGNIMVMTDERGEEIIKILDFGIAKALTSTAKVSREIGTVYYASPEQLSKGSDIDRRSDIYSLGVMLYQLLTGAVPFDDDSIERIIYQKLNHDPPRLRELRPDVPAPVEEIVQRALARDPEGRYQDATELARAFWRSISLETGVLVVDCVDATTRTSLAGASVLLNGKYAGQTDSRGHWRQSGMLPRQYLVELESPRYQRWRTSIRIDSREEVSLTVELQREPKGDLIIACGVPGARVEVEGRKSAATDETGRLFLEAVDAGKHRLRISHSRYLPAEAEINVGIGEQAFLELALTPKTVIWRRKPIIVASGLAALALTAALAYQLAIKKRPAVAAPSPEVSPTVFAKTPPAQLPEISPAASTEISAASSTNPSLNPSPSTSTSTLSSSPNAPASPTPAIVAPSVDAGLRALRNRRYQEAVYHLRQFPKDPRALEGLADSYFRLNQLDNAAAKYEELSLIKTGDRLLFEKLGDIYTRLGKHDRAIEKYLQLVAGSPNDSVANFKLCQVYYTRGGSSDYGEAVKRCGIAIRINQDYADAYVLIDQSYQKLGRNGNEQAKNFYKSLWSARNKKPLPIYYQGLAYARMGKRGDVESHVRLLEQLGSPLAGQLKQQLNNLGRP